MNKAVAAERRRERAREYDRMRGLRPYSGARPRTIAMNRLSQHERDEWRRQLPVVDHARPRTRGECPVFRPCPYVGCVYNLFLEVLARGNLSMRFPDREPEDMPPLWSCALDVADRGSASLEEVGAALNIVRERVRQIETETLRKMAKRGGPKLRALVAALADLSHVQSLGERIEERA
jgi:hypothetical protein